MNSIENNDELRKCFLSDEDYSEFCTRYRSDKRARRVRNVQRKRSNTTINDSRI